MFPALPGRYVARLTVTPASGTPTVLTQPFSLLKDPMVIMSDADLKALYAFRLDVTKLQRTLREQQAELDTVQRAFAAAKRAADSSGTTISPELKAQIASVEKEIADVNRELGSAAGGRGGFGGFGAFGAFGGAATTGRGVAGAGRGGAGAGRGGPGGRGATIATQAGQPTTGNAPPVEDEQTPTQQQTPQNIQTRLGTTTEMLNATFNPSPAQKKTVQTLPADIEKEADRVKKISSTDLPALIKALKDAGVTVGR
jgi:hypothetical protein